MPAYQGCQQVLRELAEANRLLQTLQQTRCKSLPARAVVGHINTDRGGGVRAINAVSLLGVHCCVSVGGVGARTNKLVFIPQTSKYTRGGGEMVVGATHATHDRKLFFTTAILHCLRTRSVRASVYRAGALFFWLSLK